MNLEPKQRRIHMYIAGEEVVCNSSFTITEEMKNVNTIILNNCYPLSWEADKDYVSRYYNPKDYSLFKLTNEYTGFNLTTESDIDLLTEAGQTIEVQNSEVIAFLGIVKRNTPLSLNPNKPHYNSLQVVDFRTFLSEGDVFNFVIEETTAIDFLNKVIGEYSGYNFIVGNTDKYYGKNTIINNYNCDQKTLYDVLEYVCQVTQAVWNVRYVDETTFAIDFYTMSSLPSGMALYDTAEFCNNNSIIDISYSFNTSNYRNKQIMTAPEITSETENIQEFFADSDNGEYTLDNNIASVTEARLDETYLNVGTKEDKDNGMTIDLLYTPGTNIVKLDYQPLPTQILTIKYMPLLRGRIAIFNTNEINRISEQLNNVGVISRYEERKDAATETELGKIGTAYIEYKGMPEITLKVKSINKDLWNIGNSVYFYSTNIPELKFDYVVKKKEINQIQNNADNSCHIIYTYELGTNFRFERDVNYFDNQRAKNIGNIKKGEFINKYIEQVDPVNIIFDEPIIS